MGAEAEAGVQAAQEAAEKAQAEAEASCAAQLASMRGELAEAQAHALEAKVCRAAGSISGAGPQAQADKEVTKRTNAYLQSQAEHALFKATEESQVFDKVPQVGAPLQH